MSLSSKLESLKLESYNYAKEQQKPGSLESVSGFFSSIAASLRFVLSEKENVVFAILQWMAIIGTYFVWVQVLRWIPEEIWKDSSENNEQAAVNIVLIVWSFLCVGVVACFIGIFTACLNASCILRSQKRESTFIDCLRLGMQYSWTLWVFSWIDGWWTTKRIFERLPKKNDRTSAFTKAQNEAIYQAWKLVSLGFIPSILFGRTVPQACKDSIELTRKRFWPLAKLRFGYSFLCWIIGISCYVGVVFFFAFMDNMPERYDIYSWYFYAGFPIILAALIVIVLFRPLYIISACRIYVSYACDAGIKPNLPKSAPKVVSLLIVLLLLMGLLGAALLFHTELGIDKFIVSK